MPNRQEITSRLADRLKKERTAIGLSLDGLAKISGVSRSMLSQIERGESSPTVASLWNLTRALNVDFSSLLDHDIDASSPIVEIVRDGQTPVITNQKAACTFRILSAPSEVGGTEVYDVVFKAGAKLESEAHKTGCVEHLSVLSGALTVIADNKKVKVSSGDTIRYRADRQHTILAAAEARALLIVKNA